MRILRAALSGIVLIGAAAAPVSAAPCEMLRSFTRPNTSITAATVVAAGTFVPPRTFDAPPGGLPRATQMPEICRVQGVLTPSVDSHIEFEWNQQAALLDPVSHIPARKVPAIESAVIEACDARDGVKDGIVDNPSACRFKAESLRCSGAETDACLTAPQVAMLQKAYDGPRTASGQQLYPGFPPGGESGPGGWALWFAGERPGASVQSLFATQGASNLVRQDAAYSVKAFDVSQAAAS